MTFAAIVVAAGSGSRAGGRQAVAAAGRQARGALVGRGAAGRRGRGGGRGRRRRTRRTGRPRRWRAWPAGAPSPAATTRADSVRAGLAALTGAGGSAGADPRRRPAPAVRRGDRPAAGGAGRTPTAPLPALPVADTLKRGADGAIDGTVDRDGPVAGADAAGLPRATGCCAAYAAWPDGRDADRRRRRGRARRRPWCAWSQGDPRLMKLTYPGGFRHGRGPDPPTPDPRRPGLRRPPLGAGRRRSGCAASRSRTTRP